MSSRESGLRLFNWASKTSKHAIQCAAEAMAKSKYGFGGQMSSVTPDHEIGRSKEEMHRNRPTQPSLGDGFEADQRQSSGSGGVRPASR
jgi:hypothetical protein